MNLQHREFRPGPGITSQRSRPGAPRASASAVVTAGRARGPCPAGRRTELPDPGEREHTTRLCLCLPKALQHKQHLPGLYAPSSKNRT